MQNGGARPGAGRKPKAEQFKVPIARAEKQIADRLPALIDNMLTLADGYKTFDEDGSVYTKGPDYKANAYLIDRIMGKPTERVEHDIDSEITELLARLSAVPQEETSG